MAPLSNQSTIFSIKAVGGFVVWGMASVQHCTYLCVQTTQALKILGAHNLLDPYNPTVIDYLQSDGTGHLLGVYTVRVTCVCELTSQHSTLHESRSTRI